MRPIVLFAWLALIAPIASLAPVEPFAPVALSAQESGGEEGEPLFTARDALWAGGFAAGTLLVAPLDIEIAEAVRDSLLQKNRWISTSAGGLRLLGFPGSVLVTGGMYAAGRLTDRPVLADMGLHSAQAILIATAITLGTKSLAGRARPYTDPQNPLNFKLGRGWRNDPYQSFPSGHTTAAFATAAAITAEVEHRWPDSELVVGTALFGAAALIGVSRLYHNVHWASDAAVGAGIGSFAGWKVVQYTHSNPDNRMDRWLLGVTISPAPGGRTARLWIAPAF
jgi:membrane-associated phospholipid phosphatase